LDEGDKADLIKDFSLEEIKSVMMEMKECSAPGLDGFGVTFYQIF
jgi:hypothetical protein